MRFKKSGEDTHGPIVSVITDQGFSIGTIMKWHGLFVANDWNGQAFSMPHRTRKGAANMLLEHFEFERKSNQPEQ